MRAIKRYREEEFYMNEKQYQRVLEMFLSPDMENLGLLEKQIHTKDKEDIKN